MIKFTANFDQNFTGFTAPNFNMSLVQFKKYEDGPDGYATYHLKFNDGSDFIVSSVVLRNNCPCAACKGEEVLLHKYEPVKNQIGENGFRLENVQTVGNYAILLSWKDGHNTGIYTWDYLKEICSKETRESNNLFKE